jgi:hypothetical protein
MIWAKKIFQNFVISIGIFQAVGRLIRWSPLLTLSPKSSAFKPQKKNKKLKFYQAIRNLNQFFHGFNAESTTETSGWNFMRDFDWSKLRILQKSYKISSEDSVERKPEKFSKFRAKINYCVFVIFAALNSMFLITLALSNPKSIPFSSYEVEIESPTIDLKIS